MSVFLHQLFNQGLIMEFITDEQYDAIYKHYEDLNLSLEQMNAAISKESEDVIVDGKTFISVYSLNGSCEGCFFKWTSNAVCLKLPDCTNRVFKLKEETNV